MSTEQDFAAILKEKIGSHLSDIETPKPSLYEPFLYEFDFSNLKLGRFSHLSQGSGYQTYHEKRLPPSEPVEQSQTSRKQQEPCISHDELSGLGAVAFRTLSGLSPKSLPTVLSLATAKQIKRDLSKQLHPDLGGDPDDFIKMLEAYEILLQEVNFALSKAS